MNKHECEKNNGTEKASDFRVCGQDSNSTQMFSGVKSEEKDCAIFKLAFDPYILLQQHSYIRILYS